MGKKKERCRRHQATLAIDKPNNNGLPAHGLQQGPVIAPATPSSGKLGRNAREFMHPQYRHTSTKQREWPRHQATTKISPFAAPQQLGTSLAQSWRVTQYMLGKRWRWPAAFSGAPIAATNTEFVTTPGAPRACECWNNPCVPHKLFDVTPFPGAVPCCSGFSARDADKTANTDIGL